MDYPGRSIKKGEENKDIVRTMKNSLLVHPGSIFIIDHGNGSGHTGIVRSVSDGYIQTIEGNTNIAGSREGLGVAELKRKINVVMISVF